MYKNLSIQIPVTSRIFYVNSEAFSYDKIILLETKFTDEARNFWTFLYENDLIILQTEYVGLLEFKVLKLVSKRLYLSAPEPLVLEFKEICNTYSNDSPFDDTRNFQEIREDGLGYILRKSEEFPQGQKISFPKSKHQIFLKEGDYKVRLANTAEDFHFIKKLSRDHPFGYAFYYMGLILSYQDEDVAALTFDKANCVNREHSEERRTFKGVLDIVRRNSIVIKRIYSPPKYFKYHYYLLKILFEKIAPALIYNRQYSTIQALSFDYHPHAPTFNMSAVIPRTKTDSFFYYRYLFKENEEEIDKKEVRVFLDKRKEISYYRLFEDENIIFEALQSKVLKETAEFVPYRGTYFLIKKKDVIFLFSNKNGRLCGIIEVDKVDQENIEGTDYGKDLFIYFHEKSKKNIDFTLPKNQFKLSIKILEIDKAEAIRWLNIRKTYKKEEIKMADEYYLVATKKNISLGIKEQMWGLKRSKENLAHYNSLRSGDIVHLVSDKEILVASAKIKNKMIKERGPFAKFPLTFELVDIDPKNQYLSNNLERYLKSKSGGIIKANQLLKTELEPMSETKKPQGIELKPGEIIVKPNKLFLPEVSEPIERNSIFVIQAWNYKDNVYKEIEKYLTREGFTCYHASKEDSQIVMKSIWSMLNKCEAVIVDFSDSRPNVYLEFGMALVLGKPIIALCQNRKEIPSDFPQSKYLEYSIAIEPKFLIDPEFESRLIKKVKDIFKNLRE